jgi:hypothetical protein
LTSKIKIILNFALPVLFIVSNSLSVKAQEKSLRFYDPEKKFSITLYGTYISASQLLENPRSSNPIERDVTTELNGGYGYGAELNYTPPLFETGLIIYASAEYFKVTSDNIIYRLYEGENRVSVRFTEKFTLIPLELGIKWHLPVSTDNFKIYIGGGGGIYFGDRTRNFAGMTSENIAKTPGFSLNVLTGLEYYIARNLSANFELKFREASFDAESKYSKGIVNINGNNYNITNPFYTRFIIDGVRISAGFKYQF